MNPRRLLGPAIVIVLALAGCGGESEDASVAEAIAADLRSEQAFADDLREDEARCVGDAIVADLGVDGARDLGRADAGDADDGERDPFDVDALTSDEIDAVGGAMEDCVEALDEIVVDLVAEGILEAPDEDFPVTAAEADCVGRGVADRIPFGRLLAIGLESTDDGDLGQLTDDEAIAFGATFVDCVDVRAILLAQVADSGADAEVVECLDAEISDEAIELLFVDTFAGDVESAEGAFAGAVDACT